MISTANIAVNIKSNKVSINNKKVKLDILKNIESEDCIHNQY